MRTFLLLLSILFISGTISAQKEKIKGNKIVMTEEKIVATFHTIEVYDNFDITIEENSDPIITIEADSNLHEFIVADVLDGVLKIESSKDLRRAKALNIRISYTSELKRIAFYNKVTAKSLSPIKSSELTIESHDTTEIFLSLETGKLTSESHGKSDVELHTTSKEAFYQINENAKLKGIITADSLKIDLYQKAYTKLEGDVKSALIRIDNDSNFYGEKLTTVKTSLIAEGTSDCYLLVKEDITINAADQTEIYLMGEPKINITTFANEATLYKKKIDYIPSRLLLN